MTAPAAGSGAEGFPTAECRACHGSIIWAVTVQNRRAMPVDAVPHKTGNVRLRWEGGGQVAAIVVSAALAFGAKGLRLSHFASCPKAHLWREGRRGGMSTAEAFKAIGRPTS